MQATAHIFFTIFLIATAFFFVARYAHMSKAREMSKRQIEYRWAGWYPRERIEGTSSGWFRQFMLGHNRMTTAMWASLALAASCFFLGRYGS